MMDVSDGLLLDCQRMARASCTSFHLDSRSFAVADPMRANACVRWGDDYQLLFTAPPETVVPVPATRIGLVDTKDRAPLWVDGDIPDGDWLGFQHR